MIVTPITIRDVHFIEMQCASRQYQFIGIVLLPGTTLVYRYYILDTFINQYKAPQPHNKYYFVETSLTTGCHKTCIPFPNTVSILFVVVSVPFSTPLL